MFEIRNCSLDVFSRHGARKVANDRAAADMNKLHRVDRGGGHRLAPIRIKGCCAIPPPWCQELGEDATTTFVNCM
jgi:hypothetical protein